MSEPRKSTDAKMSAYRDALARIVAADDAKRAANASGVNASPISRWIPMEEAVAAARELLRTS